MRVSDVQERLRALAALHNIPELDRLAGELSRRSPVKRAASTSAPMTDRLRKQIADFARANPTLSYVEVANKFNVNPGRVSEAVRGVRR